MNNAMMDKRNDLLAQTVIKGLNSRHMAGYYVQTKDEALAKALELIPEGSKVSMGGGASVEEIGLVAALKEGNYNYIDRNSMKGEEKRAAELEAYTCDVFLGSCNAITDDGILVNIDGNANRVSAYAFGPKKLVLIVGMNKVCADVDSALKRARNSAAVANAQRFPINTPCKLTGKCMDCKAADSICAQFLITRVSMHKDRIHVILVNDTLGY